MSVRSRIDSLEERINERLPRQVKIGAGVLYLHRSGGSERLDALAERPGWDRWHDCSIGLLLACQVAVLGLVLTGAWLALQQSAPTALNAPVNTIAIPGTNAFMPLAAAPSVIAALVIATVAHEFGHAIACRREEIPLQETGIALLFGVVPLAAYVLPGEKLDTASRRSRLRVFAAGVANNLVVAAVALAVLLAPATGTAMDAYMLYFGWAVTGGVPPTAESIAALGLVTNLAFWTALLSANFGLLNALPVTLLDGGRVLSLVLEWIGESIARPISARRRRGLVHTTGVVAVLAVVIAILGPYLRF
ncbi:site-2 protease family protein [Natrialba sp. SSL1]|uniref:site-2 protease family protein n=1 Tax=Natrialba sp. SSL1 TaxID=1869245 RepID=UPI0008F8A291|nr:site-2 protease family protein [Natrialba sp. SSL1]OIB55555.1 peptidase M50 [Natrialba sp. SSL1]